MPPAYHWKSIVAFLALMLFAFCHAAQMQVNMYWDGGCSNYGRQYNFGGSDLPFNKCINIQGQSSNLWSANVADWSSINCMCGLYSDSNCRNQLSKKWPTIGIFGPTSALYSKCFNDNGSPISSIICAC